MILSGFALSKIQKERNLAAALLKKAAESGDTQKVKKYERRLRILKNTERLM